MSDSGGRTGRFIRVHLPFLLYGAAIYTVSSIPYLRGPVTPIISFDKVVHFCEYGLFAILASRSFLALAGNRKRTKVYLLTLLFTAVFAASDEYLQSFVPGRTSSVADLAADVLGGGVAIIFLFKKGVGN